MARETVQTDPVSNAATDPTAAGVGSAEVKPGAAVVEEGTFAGVTRTSAADLTEHAEVPADTPNFDYDPEIDELVQPPLYVYPEGTKRIPVHVDSSAKPGSKGYNKIAGATITPIGDAKLPKKLFAHYAGSDEES